jgi:hypothetical protein
MVVTAAVVVAVGGTVSAWGRTQSRIEREIERTRPAFLAAATGAAAPAAPPSAEGVGLGPRTAAVAAGAASSCAASASGGVGPRLPLPLDGREAVPLVGTGTGIGTDSGSCIVGRRTVSAGTGAASGCSRGSGRRRIDRRTSACPPRHTMRVPVRVRACL